MVRHQVLLQDDPSLGNMAPPQVPLQVNNNNTVNRRRRSRVSTVNPLSSRGNTVNLKARGSMASKVRVSMVSKGKVSMVSKDKVNMAPLQALHQVNSQASNTGNNPLNTGLLQVRLVLPQRVVKVEGMRVTRGCYCKSCSSVYRIKTSKPSTPPARSI